MAFTSFIPQIWNAEMLLAFRQAAVAANLSNGDYTGNASAGNKVTVNTASAVAITDYKAAGRVTSASAVASTSIDLLIDQEKSFDFKVDDIDRRQAAGNLGAYTTSAGQGLAEDADKFLLALASGATTHQTASTITTGDEALNIIRDLRKALNKSLVPIQNRVVLVNAEFEGILLDAASKITSVDTSGSPDGLREANVGRLLGFNVYMSENLPIVTRPQAVAYYVPALAYVSQIEETEALRAADSFADRLRGLHVYGGKAVRATGFAAWTATVPV